jgi:hypothetical protein
MTQPGDWGQDGRSRRTKEHDDRERDYEADRDVAAAVDADGHQPGADIHRDEQCEDVCVTVQARRLDGEEQYGADDEQTKVGPRGRHPDWCLPLGASVLHSPRAGCRGHS